MIGRLFARILSAIVIFMFLCLAITMLGNVFVPSAPVPDEDMAGTPREILESEIEDVMGQLETLQGGEGQLGILIIALPIVLIAGFSDAIGHIAVLFANRVRPNRFAVTILINTILFVITYLIWVGMVALVSFIIFQRQTAFIRAALAVMIAYVPLIYSFLIALPYLGVLIANILHLLTAIFLMQLLQVFFPYSLAEAALCTILSLVAVIAFRLTIGRPIEWVRGKLINVVAGTAVHRNVNEALAYVESQGGQS